MLDRSCVFPADELESGYLGIAVVTVPASLLHATCIYIQDSESNAQVCMQLSLIVSGCCCYVCMCVRTCTI